MKSNHLFWVLSCTWLLSLCVGCSNNDRKSEKCDFYLAYEYNRENETYNFLKRNVQFSLFFHPIKAKAFNHHLSGN